MDNHLLDAQCLATFANLGPDQTDEFRNSICPDFLPASFWDKTTITTTVDSSWLLLQRFLQEVWNEKFPLDKSIQLIIWADKETKLAQSLERVSQMSNQEILSMEAPKPDVWPFQRAVMFLAVNSWRARFCLGCGKRFVAAKPRSTYCSDACFKENRKDVKRAWWSQHGQQLRESKARSMRTKNGKKG